ncbi:MULTISPECIES: YihY/virulence factor BrkB family protein [unclassified Halomonas]|uniref:YihY/virulence factor BrkB family protein n=1 Tax=unclassified Halomonas TaxID=2609666 RepID=UPI0006DA85B1|nr:MULTISPECIES: YihY/virulence factor BrkB family protein [unclassified Halomonas]KPQ20395.1 MAG: putative membrane protein [Halomonas sp. HL-93]SBR50708.1 membrane protein [Halomonas sp. HL-93]SNY96995.1 membrane protein [Halomonas sp. hl-4]
MSKLTRGRQAELPHEIPKTGWHDIVWRVVRSARRDRIMLLAAGVAFYALLALFPTIAAVISIWGLFFDPYEASQQLYSLIRLMPPEAAKLIDEQAQDVVDSVDSSNEIGALVGLLVAMFIASKGVSGLIVGLNVVYGERERRNVWQLAVLVTTMTLGLIIMTLLSLGFIALVPMLVDALAVVSPFDRVIDFMRWPALLVMMSAVIALLYRFAPYRRSAKWEWLSVGTMVATLFWLLGSGGLSLYVRYFSNFSELYGSLGAVVVLMFWFLLSAFVVLLGAEINCELERQTRQDTTVGEDRPLGQREAYAADTLGRQHPWHEQDDTLPPSDEPRRD